MTDPKFYSRVALLVFISMMGAAAVFLLMAVGCAGQGTPSEMASVKPVDKLYVVSRQEAVNLAKWAVEQALPEQKVLPLKKPRLGFLVHETVPEGIAKYARFKATAFIYEIDLLSMQGLTAQGQHMVGYTYTVKGDGDLKTGHENLDRLEQRLQEVFEQTGRAVAVTASRPHTISSRPPPVTSPAQAPKPQPPTAKDDDVFTKLKKLKELHDQGIITEEEFQTKKKALLDRM